MPKKKEKATKKQLKDEETEHLEAEEMTRAVEFAEKVAEVERIEGVITMQMADKAMRRADKEIMEAIRDSTRIKELQEKGASEKEIEKAAMDLKQSFKEGVVASAIAESFEGEALEQMVEAFIAESILETLMELSVEETEEALRATLKGKIKEKKDKAPKTPKAELEK